MSAVVYLVNQLVNKTVELRMTDGNVYVGKLRRVVDNAAVLIMSDDGELIVNLDLALTATGR